MNSLLLNRASGSLSAKSFESQYGSRLLHAIQPSDTRFCSADGQQDEPQEVGGNASTGVHPGGVSSITIDRFEGRYLLSAGADSSIQIWDLESSETNEPTAYRPLGAVTRWGPSAHKRGITAISFYPFDSLAFTSSSYDHTVKIWSSERLVPSASFDLNSVVYSHATSPIADHLLVACATQHPQIRLVDLRSGAAAQALAGHQGAVMSVAWSPKDHHILASGGTDGSIRFWDVRRSAAQLSSLDMEDSVGILGHDGSGQCARHREGSKAHNGPVNGLVWTPDGRYLVSAGHDEKVRVWDAIKGANTLASFGPLVRNRELRTSTPCLASSDLLQPGKDVLFYPSDREILMCELFEGKMLKRLKPPGQSNLPTTNKFPGRKGKVNELAWRHHHVELYSAQGDGTIRAWKPRTSEDAAAEKEENEEVRMQEEDRQRKRKALEDVYNDLAKKRFAV